MFAKYRKGVSRRKCAKAVAMHKHNGVVFNDFWQHENESWLSLFI